jgi:aspartate racemase
VTGKTLGLIGGIGPESTIEYYRLIVAAYRERSKSGGYPSIIINSVDLQRLLDWMNANELEKVTDYLVLEIERLQSSGADFAALSSNTPHIVFDEIQRRVKLPLISIVEAACDKVQRDGFKTVGLFGTRFTMRANFYPDVFSRAGITLILPNEDEQTYIHDHYIGELLNNIFLPETRARMLEIADEVKARDGIEALILGGTELPLLLRDKEHNGIRLLNTSSIHVDRLVDELLRES